MYSLRVGFARDKSPNLVAALSDFNLHDKKWNGAKSKRKHATAKRPLQRADAAGIACVLPQRTITYLSGAHFSSTMDIIFAYSRLNVCVLRHSGHRVVRSVFKVEPGRDLSKRFLLRKCAKVKLQKTISLLLSRIRRPKLKIETDVDI
ncbi:zinc knuckle [Colletotrichum incanum]|uniref:Zinc knuckle n=1 Tax=Colletotrichum incanum TaxID=1573173 RepID=A0A167AGR1_COLIC|nr:zinc knuckle [Colletotrichum incanum]